jgi:hypothetical protein
MALPAQNTTVAANPGAQDNDYNAALSASGLDGFSGNAMPGTPYGNLPGQQFGGTSAFGDPAYNPATDPNVSNADNPASGTNVGPTNANVGSNSSLTSLLSSLSSGFSSPLGQLALFGGAAAGLESQASSANSQNNALAAQISQIGQPFLTAGSSELSAYQKGQLTQPFQQQLSTIFQQNQQAATSQQNQVATALAGSSGGQNISGALTSQTAGIQNNQSMLNNNAVAAAYAGELSAATGLFGAGAPYVQQGILTEIQSNQNLQTQLMQIFSGLSSAYAQSTGGGGTGTAGGGTAGAGGIGGLANNIGKAINQLTGPSVNGGTALGTGSAADPLNTYNLSGGGTMSNADIMNDIGMGGGDTLGSDTGQGVLDDISSYFPSAGGQAAGAAAEAGALTPVAGGDLSAIGTDLSVSEDPSVAAAVNAAGGGASALGTAIPVAGAALGAYSTVNNIEQGNALGAGLSGAETGAAIGSFIGPEGTLIGAGIGGLVGLGGALAKGKHTQENVAQVGPGQNVIKLQSGNSALAQGSVAFGAGSSRGQGSAQWFLVPQATGTIEKTTGSNAGAIGGAQGGQPTVTKGTPFYIGGQASADLTNFANTVPLVNGQPNFASYISQYRQDPDANTGLVGVYNNNGGQAAWGMNYSQWLNAIWSVKRNVTGNLSTS